jgi:hypothetical protein
MNSFWSSWEENFDLIYLKLLPIFPFTFYYSSTNKKYWSTKNIFEVQQSIKRWALVATEATNFPTYILFTNCVTLNYMDVVTLAT